MLTVLDLLLDKENYYLVNEENRQYPNEDRIDILTDRIITLECSILEIESLITKDKLNEVISVQDLESLYKGIEYLIKA